MLPLPPLYPITSALGMESLSVQVTRYGAAGFPLVQFRGKPLDPEPQWRELRTSLECARDNGGWPLVVVNDRADLAVLAAQAGLAPWGLHLGQDDLPAAEALRLPGLADLHVGASTHNGSEWSSPDPRCDYAGAGPFRGTATKPDHAPPIGAEGLARACAALRARSIAPIAIGGLGLEDAPACFRAGAESLAMSGTLQQAADPAGLLWTAQLERWRVRPPFARGQGILLAGSSGAGKSALASALAARLGLACVDLDDRISRRNGRSIPDLFAEGGEGFFRELEARELAGCLAQPAVVALGGGAWETGEVRRLAADSGFAVLWLAERPDLCWERAGGDPGRPLAVSRSDFMARHRQRIQRWSALPCVLPLARTPAALAEALAAALD